MTPREGWQDHVVHSPAGPLISPPLTGPTVRRFTETEIQAIVKHAFDAGMNAGRSNPARTIDEIQPNYPAITRFAIGWLDQ